MENGNHIYSNFFVEGFEGVDYDYWCRGAYTYLKKENWEKGCFDDWAEGSMKYQFSLFFPLLKEDGGCVKDLKMMKRLIDTYSDKFNEDAWALSCHTPYSGYLDDDIIDMFRTAMRTYVKVSDDPIFQAVLDKYHWWNEEEKKEIIKERKEEMKKADEARQRNLLRFIHAQDGGGIYDNTSTYATALQEIRNGRKRTHWIWYVFPQMKGLAHSEIAKFYGIDGREEATMYINHPILKKRLIEAFLAILESDTLVYDIFGEDTIKVRNCALLFNSIKRIPVIEDVITKYRW